MPIALPSDLCKLLFLDPSGPAAFPYHVHMCYFDVAMTSSLSNLFFFYIVGPIFYICVNPFILDFPSLCRFDFDRRYSLFY